MKHTLLYFIQEQSRQGEILKDTNTRVRETQNAVQGQHNEYARQGEVLKDTNTRLLEVHTDVKANTDGILKHATYIE